MCHRDFPTDLLARLFGFEFVAMIGHGFYAFWTVWIL